jgi:hypothetical protein
MSITSRWKEIDLFNWLKENQYPDLLKSKNQMSRWDCYSPSRGHRIELKCRKKHYDTLLLEKKKYDAMMQETSRHLDIPMYVNSTPEGIYTFNLIFIKRQWEVNYLNPATTQFANKNRVPKEVTYLNITDGIKLL